MKTNLRFPRSLHLCSSGRESAHSSPKESQSRLTSAATVQGHLSQYGDTSPHVAQIGNLLFRRLAVGGRGNRHAHLRIANPRHSRLSVCATLIGSLAAVRMVGLVFCLATSLLAQETNRAFVFEADVKVTMRDGVQLAANIWRPKGEGRYPVILMRSPYGKMDEKLDEARRYTAAGYVMVVQDCRGRGKSEGAWDPFRYDVEDGFDTQEWVGQQPWCNGEIGTAGGSYVGWTQWAAAAEREQISQGHGADRAVRQRPRHRLHRRGAPTGVADGLGHGRRRRGRQPRQTAGRLPPSAAEYVRRSVREEDSLSQRLGGARRPTTTTGRSAA